MDFGYAKNALILESHHSTHIEGTALTIEQAKSILEGKKVKGVKLDDEKELLNYKKAMDFISKYLGKDDPVTQGIIRSIKRTATRDLTGLVEKGILKRIGEKKGAYYTLSPKIMEKIRDT